MGQLRFAMTKKKTQLEQVGEKININSPPVVDHAKKTLRLAKFMAFGVFVGLMQHYYGHGENFYEYRFLCNHKKDPEYADALTDFYGNEDFMQIYCVLPFCEQIMMRGSSFDNQGICHTWGVAGNMQVSMDFEEGEGDDCLPDKPDVVGFFNKRERFLDLLWTPFGNITLWDMLVDFGYHKRRDGLVEVYHTGVSFYGPWVIRLLFHVHARYVIWATEQYVNSPHFGDTDNLEKAMHTRENVPGWVMNQFLENVSSDLEKVVEAKNRAGDHEAAMKAKQALKEIQRTKTLNLRNNTVTVMKKQTTKKTVTVKPGSPPVEENESTAASFKIGNKEAEKAIKDALQHISESREDSHAMQHLVQNTLEEKKRA